MVKLLAPLTPRFLTSRIAWEFVGIVPAIPATSSKRPMNVSPNSDSTLNVGVNDLLLNWIASGSSTHLDGNTLRLPLISVAALMSSAPPSKWCSSLLVNLRIGTLLSVPVISKLEPINLTSSYTSNLPWK